MFDLEAMMKRLAAIEGLNTFLLIAIIVILILDKLL